MSVPLEALFSKSAWGRWDEGKETNCVALALANPHRHFYIYTYTMYACHKSLRISEEDPSAFPHH